MFCFMGTACDFFWLLRAACQDFLCTRWGFCHRLSRFLRLLPLPLNFTFGGIRSFFFYLRESETNRQRHRRRRLNEVDRRLLGLGLDPRTVTMSRLLLQAAAAFSSTSHRWPRWCFLRGASLLLRGFGGAEPFKLRQLGLISVCGLFRLLSHSDSGLKTRRVATGNLTIPSFNC